MRSPPLNIVRVLRVLSLAVLVAFALPACTSSKTITKANVDEVADGMSKKQVESILGPPTTTSKSYFS